ncbi:MAG: hypothetical protein IKW04_01905 [Clostridia bacterium]|nr:hypothetical protein [Clostridia bacterium]
MDNQESKEQIIMDGLRQSSDLIGQIKLEELPAIITAQVTQIKELGIRIEDAISSADNAKDAATEAGKLSAGFGHKKKAIKELQESGKKSAEAIGDTVEALQLSFEYEKQLGDISKFLIALGTYSAEHTRKTVAQLKTEILNNGTGSKLKDVAKKQLIQVIAQLETQGETIQRQEALEKELNAQEQKDAEHDKQIQEMAEDDDRQDALIEQHAASIEELNARIAALENSLKHNGLKILVLIISIFALILSLLQVFKIL